MSRHELARGSKGLWQRIEALVRSTLPRQARVTRTEGNRVWVKFLGDGANDPESQFPSTVSGVPVATMGWVVTLGGKKGLFVATGVPMPVSDSNDATGLITATTSGVYERPEAAVTISGLTPGTTRRCKVSVTHRYIQNTGNNGAGSFGYRITSNGSTSYHSPGSVLPADNSGGYFSFIYSTLRTVGDDGEITVVPAFQWSAGTLQVQTALITLEVE